MSSTFSNDHGSGAFRVGRRRFVGGLGFAAGVAAFPQLAAALTVTASAPADAAAASLDAWDINQLTLSYPHYAEAIPHPRRRAAEPLAGLAGAGRIGRPHIGQSRIGRPIGQPIDQPIDQPMGRPTNEPTDEPMDRLFPS